MSRLSLEQVEAMPGTGRTPAVALVNPKYPHNVASALRSCAAFGMRQLWVTGDRALAEARAVRRLPREERMRSYEDVSLLWCDRFFDAFDGAVPVAVEVDATAESLTTFEHPENAVYVFGPEDGSLGRMERGLCHRFLVIPSDHCLNLSTAVTVVLAHRRMQRQLLSLEEMRPSAEMMLEGRGFADSDGRELCADDHAG